MIETQSRRETLVGAWLLGSVGLTLITVGSIVFLGVSVIWAGQYSYAGDGGVGSYICKVHFDQYMYNSCYDGVNDAHGTFWAATQTMVWKVFLTAIIVTILNWITFAIIGNAYRY